LPPPEEERDVVYLCSGFTVKNRKSKIKNAHPLAFLKGILAVEDVVAESDKLKPQPWSKTNGTAAFS
jgi:hypothetical protein